MGNARKNWKHEFLQSNENQEHFEIALVLRDAQGHTSQVRKGEKVSLKFLLQRGFFGATKPGSQIFVKKSEFLDDNSHLEAKVFERTEDGREFLRFIVPVSSLLEYGYIKL